MYKNIIIKLMGVAFIGLNILACTSNTLEIEDELYSKVVKGYLGFKGYATDSIQFRVDGYNLKKEHRVASSVVGWLDAYQGDFDFSESYDQFVFTYVNGEKTLEIVSKKDQNVLYTTVLKAPEVVLNEGKYDEEPTEPIIIPSFFASTGAFLENVEEQYAPGVLTDPANVGFKFMFPNINYFSKAGSKAGDLEVLITNASDKELARVALKEGNTFSEFVEFPFTDTKGLPYVYITVVKHGTTEPYIAGLEKGVKGISLNTSSLILLEEVANKDGSFKGISALIDLMDYFDF